MCRLDGELGRETPVEASARTAVCLRIERSALKGIKSAFTLKTTRQDNRESVEKGRGRDDCNTGLVRPEEGGDIVKREGTAQAVKASSSSPHPGEPG